MRLASHLFHDVTIEALFRVTVALKYELETFQKGQQGSLEELLLWKRCEKRLAEQAHYKEMTGDEEVVATILLLAEKNYALNCSRCVEVQYE